ncbi:hypothetical protein ED733_003594 [Metarhizium rileyi]|uniref:Uncharacterized protein n=1 Tax=Metarhizium rileyi (strain RCEF 4871) TaxID=1649241 RepID=A0A5C6GNL8_METRR|nr:hypothetical protein ED733_003594 [Metarhizium rileyi]
MSRFFTTASSRLIRWLGYDRKMLPGDFFNAVEHYSVNGAVKKVGKIESIEILFRNDGSSPVHVSSFNPQDEELIISARITPADGSRPMTHHIYGNGTAS